MRQKVAIEISEHQAWYDKDCSGLASELAKDPRIVVETYSDYLEKTIRNGEWSDIIQMYALSAVIGVPIESYCPSAAPQNNPYNRTIVGRGVIDNDAKRRMKIMWTSMTLPSPLRIENLTINHFVLLAENKWQGVH